MRTCHRCGKSCHTAFCVEIKPDPRIPEIKKTLRFCSVECANRFLGGIKTSRLRKQKTHLRSVLSSEDRKFNDDDLRLMLQTFTPKEKEHLAAVGMGILFAECDSNISRFYEKLDELVRK